MIVDSFMFMNEVELLRLRVNYLSPVVDKFVICEADRTHRGNKRDFVLDGVIENNLLGQQVLFGEPKIVPLKCMIPEGMTGHSADQYQREFMLEAIDKLVKNDDDYVMVSDLDEIPDRNVVAKKETGAYPMDLFYFKMNTQYTMSLPSGFTFYDEWFGTMGATGADFRKEFAGSLQMMRNCRDFWKRVNEGKKSGWHFSYQGGPERLKYKLNNYAHSEHDTEKNYREMCDLVQRAENAKIWSKDDERYGELRGEFWERLIEEMFVG